MRQLSRRAHACRKVTTFSVDRVAQQVWGTRHLDDCVLRRTDDDADGDYGGATDREDYYITDSMLSVVAIVDDSATLQERLAYSAYGVARHHFPADIDGDGDVDAGDIGWFADTNNHTSLGDAGFNADGDLNRDGNINTVDLIEALNWNGSAALLSGAISDPTGPDSPIGYDGCVWDVESASYIARFRTYVPRVGRWLERDPLGYLAGQNLYEYVESNPVDLSDPFGLIGGRIHHPYPLYLGGAPDQDCIKLRSYLSHRKVHRFLRNRIATIGASKGIYGRTPDIQREI